MIIERIMNFHILYDDILVLIDQMNYKDMRELWYYLDTKLSNEEE